MCPPPQLTLADLFEVWFEAQRYFLAPGLGPPEHAETDQQEGQHDDRRTDA